MPDDAGKILFSGDTSDLTVENGVNSTLRISVVKTGTNLSRDEVGQLWQSLERWLLAAHGHRVRTQPEEVYTVIICEGCGAPRVERAVGLPALSGSRNYPPCGCGGSVFEQRRLVAKRRMVVKWELEPSDAV